MEKKLAMRWVKALRSGKYKQGVRHLRSLERLPDSSYFKYEHCCLGVLGEICGINPETLNRHETLSCGLNKKCGILGETGAPRYENGDTANVKFRVNGKMIEFENLANANDQGISFRRIATWIEKNYRKL